MKVHINHKDEVRKCRALIKCRYSEGNHFDNEAEAMAFVEDKYLKENLANTFVSLTKDSSKPITESPSGENLLKNEQFIADKLKDQEGQHNFEITSPASRDLKKIEVLNYTFFQNKFEGKTGLPMEHTILANPKIFKEDLPWHHNTLAKGVICRSDKKIEDGMNNQHMLMYSIIECTNIETQEKQKTIRIDAITVPTELQGKGLATELIDEMCKQYPDLRVPESNSMSQHGKDFRKKLQKTRGEKFVGYVSEYMEFHPNAEGQVNWMDSEEYEAQFADTPQPENPYA